MFNPHYVMTPDEESKELIRLVIDDVPEKKKPEADNAIRADVPKGETVKGKGEQ